MSRRPIEFEISWEDQKAVREILRAGIQQVRVVLRAIALEQLTAGQTAPMVARIVHLSPRQFGGSPIAIKRQDSKGLCTSDRDVVPRNCWMPPKSNA